MLCVLWIRVCGCGTYLSKFERLLLNDRVKRFSCAPLQSTVDQTAMHLPLVTVVAQGDGAASSGDNVTLEGEVSTPPITHLASVLH